MKPIKIKATLKWMPTPEEGTNCDQCALVHADSCNAAHCGSGHWVISKFKVRKPATEGQI